MGVAGPLTAEAVQAVVRAELDVLDAAYERLRATCTDLAGNAFRIDVAERLEAQLRTNRGLSYRMFGEIAAPVSATDKDKGERALVRHAREQDSQFVAVVGATIADCLNPEGNFTDEDRARRRGLMLGRQGPDGMSRLTGWLDPEARSYLEAVAAAVRPGRHRVDADARDIRSPEQRCHDAVKLALKTAISSGGLGQHRGAPVTVVLTTTLTELEQAALASCDTAVPMPPAARTGGTGHLPMRDLIRMASESVHYLAVFDDHSARPLYLGRSKRLATADQRIICYARDRLDCALFAGRGECAVRTRAGRSDQVLGGRGQALGAVHIVAGRKLLLLF